MCALNHVVPGQMHLRYDSKTVLIAGLALKSDQAKYRNLFLSQWFRNTEEESFAVRNH